VEVVGGLTRWLVTLRSGAVIELWADGYHEVDGQHVFGVLADVPVEDQQGLRISGSAPTDPRRVIVTLSSIPSAEVDKVRSV